MKLTDLDAHRLNRKNQQVFESYFDKSVDFNRLNSQQARKMLHKVRDLISEQRQSSKIHTSERDPAYLKLLVLEQALADRVREAQSVGTVAPQGTQDTASSTDSESDNEVEQIKTAMTKMSRNQPLTPDEKQKVQDSPEVMAKMFSQPGMANRLEQMLKQVTEKSNKPINESEIQQAQVVLAAQDMVDKIQDSIEDATEMKFKELPALVDSIRNEVGTDQAQRYMDQTNSALETLINCLQETKAAIEGAQGILTGTEPVVPGEDEVDAGLPDIDVGGDDLDTDLEEPESDLETSLGRERR